MTTEKPRKLRLFVAVELPPPWLEGLAETQERMKAAIAADGTLARVRVRWVRPEGIHLTLKFIGEVEIERLDALRERIGIAVPGRPRINLSLAAAGSFRDRRAPRVVWVGVQDAPAQALLKLAETIDASLAVAGLPRERRGFQPHLTLGRLPDDAPDALRSRVASLATAVTMPPMTPFTVERVSLMRSILGPGGARYERLDAWPDGTLQGQ